MHSLQNGVERWYLARFETHRSLSEPFHNIDAALEQLRAGRTMSAARTNSGPRRRRSERNLEHPRRPLPPQIERCA